MQEISGDCAEQIHKISVCLAVYKTKPEYLRECIESILAQTYTDFEFLIVDDCPQDTECEKIIKSYKDNRIKYFRNEENLGISGTRNRLLGLAKGEYIAVMDHDDISLPTRFEKQVAYLDTHPKCGVVSCWYERFPDIRIKKKPEHNKQIVKALKKSCPLLHPASMIRKKVLLDNLLCYEKEYSPTEDYALWCRLVGKTEFYNIQEVLFRYRDHETNESKQNNSRMVFETQKVRKNILKESILKQLIIKFIKNEKGDKMSKITVGIIGCGFIGGALKRWLEEHNPKINIVVSDPAKGYFDDLGKADIYFISIHLPTEADGSQNLSDIREIISNLPDKPVFIRTTILPGTSAKLSEETNHEVYFMPEFLTERTAYADFCSQPMIFSAHSDLLQKIFIGKKFIEMNSLEAEITKYAHNVFGALKVTYFNGIYELCRKFNSDYNKIREGVLLSGYINEPHTQVPGPDGKFGYGGKCFPKDVNALTRLCKENELSLYALLEATKNLNDNFRKD